MEEDIEGMLADMWRKEQDEEEFIDEMNEYNMLCNNVLVPNCWGEIDLDERVQNIIREKKAYS